jgi:alkylation response protein AidB-like acyl-CoA dehydrogenase
MITADTMLKPGFDYSETQLMVAESAREFAEQYIKPHVMEWDEAQTFPAELFKKAGEMGFILELCWP